MKSSESDPLSFSSCSSSLEISRLLSCTSVEVIYSFHEKKLKDVSKKDTY